MTRRWVTALALALCASCATTAKPTVGAPDRPPTTSPQAKSPSVRNEPTCAIVYGDDFAFLISPPTGRDLACHPAKTVRVSVAGWPKGSNLRDSEAVMYLNVAGREGLSVEAFAEVEVSRFTSAHPGVKVETADPFVFNRKKHALVRYYPGDRYGDREAVAPADPGSVYFVFLVSARTHETFESSYPVFRELLGNVLRADVTFELR